MVCLGNICRSPLAEGVLQSKLPRGRFKVDSAGTGGYHIGEAPDKRSIAVAKEHGLHIEDQRCRKFKVSDFYDFDLIYVMDKNNYREVMHLAPNDRAKQKVKLLLSEVDLGFNEVPDPYYDTIAGFEKVFSMLDAACGAIAKKLASEIH